MTETATRLGCGRGTLSRLLNGKAGVSANTALSLEGVGWGTADHRWSFIDGANRNDSASGLCEDGGIKRIIPYVRVRGR